MRLLLAILLLPLLVASNLGSYSLKPRKYPDFKTYRELWAVGETEAVKIYSKMRHEIIQKIDERFATEFMDMIKNLSLSELEEEWCGEKLFFNILFYKAPSIVRDIDKSLTFDSQVYSAIVKGEIFEIIKTNVAVQEILGAVELLLDQFNPPIELVKAVVSWVLESKEDNSHGLTRQSLSELLKALYLRVPNRAQLCKSIIEKWTPRNLSHNAAIISTAVSKHENFFEMLKDVSSRLKKVQGDDDGEGSRKRQRRLRIKNRENEKANFSEKKGEQPENITIATQKDDDSAIVESRFNYLASLESEISRLESLAQDPGQNLFELVAQVFALSDTLNHIKDDGEYSLDLSKRLEALGEKVQNAPDNTGSMNLIDIAVKPKFPPQEIRGRRWVFVDEAVEVPKFIGMYNEGATCYFNSFIQSIVRIRVLRSRIFNAETEGFEGLNFPSELQKLFLALAASRPDANPIRARSVVESLRLNPGVQMDVFEFFERYFLESLNQRQININDLIQINHIEHISLAHGVKPRRRNEPARDPIRVENFGLRVTVPGRKSLLDALRQDSIEDLTGFRYYDDGPELPCTKTRRFTRLPPILMIFLNRFIHPGKNAKEGKKANSRFEFGEVLDMTEFVDEKALGDESYEYQLMSVISHAGEIGYGHYKAFVTDLCDDQIWRSYDDGTVTVTSFKKMRSLYGNGKRRHNAAALIYVRRSRAEYICGGGSTVPEHVYNSVIKMDD